MLSMTQLKSKATRTTFVLCTVLAVLVAIHVLLNSQTLSTGYFDVLTIIFKDNTSGSLLGEGKHDFRYDKERWEKNRPRIVVLAGPHKTASTTLQDFFTKLTGLSISVENDAETPITKYPNSEWVWPYGIKSEIDGWCELETSTSPNKFYSTLTGLLPKSIPEKFFPEWSSKTEEEQRELRLRAVDYFRSLFGRPWRDGMKIVIGAENFDSLVKSLGHRKTAASNHGEETHVSPHSANMIDTFLEFLPFDENLNVSDSSDRLRPQPLQLEDIEIQINYRTPRIDHIVSFWHQHCRRECHTSLKSFVMQVGAKRVDQQNPEINFNSLNSLALALQFVRKGIKTTIVDMKGVFEMDSKNSIQGSTTKDIKNNAMEKVVGGLQGVVACDILRMGSEDKNGPGIFCDDQSKLHLPNYEVPVESKNIRNDKNQKMLTDKQLADINRVYEEYDCGVWQHLKKYQEQGLLRVLYPSEHLFETCKPDKSNADVSFYSTMLKAAEIAS